MEETVSVIFSVDELWLLQACVRHEVAQIEQWKFPPASLSLNDDIAAAIVLCTDHGLSEAALMLNRHDCLVIDFNVPATAKDTNGKPIGKMVLLKSYQARGELENRLAMTESSGEEIDIATVREKLSARAKRLRRNDDV